jgi:YidC/Oxa1 family membrane protein insertase
LAEFKNPNQGGGGGGGRESQSLMVMLLVMFVGVLGYMWWQSRNQPAPQPAQTTQSAPAAQLPPLTASAPLTQPGAAPAAAVASTPAIPAIQAAAETTTTVENELYKITFSNRGGQVIHWVIKHCGGGKPQPVCTDDHGDPLDLVHSGAAKLYGYPLSLYTYDPGMRQNLAQALYVPSATGTLQAPATLSFNYAYGGYVVHKTFTFGDDSVIHADTELTYNGAPVRALLAWPSNFGDMETMTSFGNLQLDFSSAGKDNHDAPKNVVGGATTTEPLDFAGVSDQYFAAIFIPDQPQDATMVSLHNELDARQPVSSEPWYKFAGIPSLTAADFQPVSGSLPKGFARLPIIGAAVGSTSGHNRLRLFVGPKALPMLKSIPTADGGNLGPVLSFGFWSVIAKPLYYALHFVQEHWARNWGWAIILFTALINVVVLPLRIQGMRSALKMQRIQPQVDLIKAKYKNPKPTDPKAGEMNAEVMAYQKTQGVSMFGGCLPNLIPMPMLIAFFYMVNKIVELRHAHWFYLHDLSQPDPYHILPLLMFATSFLAQYYTPSPGVDPQQQKMMAFMMPVFSAYMTWNYAAALGLYWNIGNFIMIIQQQIMNRTSLGREIRELQAKRVKRPTGPPQKSMPSPKTIPGRR